VEHVAPRPSAPSPALPAGEPWPDLCFVRFGAQARLAPGRAPRLAGRGEARRELERALATPRVDLAAPALDGWRSSLDREQYEAGVRTIIELVRAGECYQANLTRMLATNATVDPVALWRAVAAGNPAPHSLFLRIGDRAVVSASPERFLRVDGDAVETRPIKGTACDEATLRASAKDRAENVMIVDLARNDLGRVCAPGSIAVPALCTPEPHPGLVHLVSTVRGRLRTGVGLGGLLRATFPPASVTGAPKPRVLQVIEDLEPVRRGVYCGAVGWIDAERRRADLAVAIRTFTLGPDGCRFGVGAGITADSDPAAEWAETELKAARLLALAAGRHAPAPLALGV
jgi:para-aminobenzoate synthetase component 1